MNTLEFLRAVWPSEGWYCLVTFQEDVIRHFWYDTIEGAASAVTKFDAAGVTVYFACATFKEKTKRKATNVLSVGSCWIDLDVGEGENKFATAEDAAAALKKFIAAHDLPRPFIVTSGGGFHAYWLYGRGVEVTVAKEVARAIKELAAADNFDIDPSRTADFASILRPVGSSNTKYYPARTVQALTPAVPVVFEEFRAAVLRDVPKKTKTRTSKTPSINQDFLAPNTPSNPNLVADRCRQIREFRDTQGRIPEPQWYAGIEVLYHCTGGEETIHAWSQGHPDYNVEQTSAKIEQIKALGPTTCVTFHSRNPSGCKGCPHWGKVTSPIQLGREYEVIYGASDEEESNTASEDGFVEAPAPFKRTTSGIVFTNDDDIDVPVHPHDLIVSDIAHDPFLSYAVVTIQHQLPKDGWKKFTFRCSDVSAPRDFEKTMRDNNVMPRNSKLLQAYVTRYMEAVQTARPTRTLFSSMGWNGDNCIVLGDKAYFSDGREERAGLSAALRVIAPAFEPKGELEPWVAATEILNQPDMEAHAFMFTIGPGALLMRFSGFEATMFNALGKSNSGKTSMGRFLMSMYGDYDQLKLKKDDTENGKIGRISLLGSLPTYIEEVTNEEATKVSNFCYEVTQGRSKLRLRTDGSEREIRQWNTIVVSSSNTSISSKLGLAKSNPDAERLRLFEFPLERTAAFEGAPATDTFWKVSENHGHAGIKYARYLVENREVVKALVTKTIEQLTKACAALPEERMWIAAIGCCLAGAHIMKNLGLIRFDVKRIALWTIKQVHAARVDMSDERVSPMEMLSYYLSEHASSILVVSETGMTATGMGYHETRRPTNELHIRYDTTDSINKLWVEQMHFKRWCIERHENYRKIRQELIDAQVCLGVTRRTLGKGTNYASGAVNVLEIDMNHPAMGNTVVRPVQSRKPRRLMEMENED